MKSSYRSILIDYFAIANEVSPFVCVTFHHMAVIWGFQITFWSAEEILPPFINGAKHPKAVVIFLDISEVGARLNLF